MNENIMSHYMRMLKKYDAENLDELRMIVPILYFKKRKELLSLQELGIEIKDVEKQAEVILEDIKAIEILAFLHREL